MYLTVIIFNNSIEINSMFFFCSLKRIINKFRTFPSYLSMLAGNEHNDKNGPNALIAR